EGWMPERFAIFGLGRTEYDDSMYREKLHEGLTSFSRSGKPKAAKWADFNENIHYLQSDIKKEADYERLGRELDELDAAWGGRANRLFYLSVAPQFIGTVSANLKKSKLADSAETDRIVVEKPFGHNMESAIALNRLLTDS